VTPWAPGAQVQLLGGLVEKQDRRRWLIAGGVEVDQLNTDKVVDARVILA
jgi:hypothetical protein